MPQQTATTNCKILLGVQKYGHFADVIKYYCPLTRGQWHYIYRAWNKGMHILLSNSHAGSGRTVKQEQEEISRNHVLQAFIPGSVLAATIAMR